MSLSKWDFLFPDRALDFAMRKHGEQERKCTGIPYIVHPFAVAMIANKFWPFHPHYVCLLAAALLHDTVEDTDTTIDEIKEKFSLQTSSLVAELTTDKEEAKRVGKNVYLIKKMTTMSDDALFLKLCDRLSNVTDHPTAKSLSDTIVMCEALHERCSKEPHLVAILAELLKRTKEAQGVTADEPNKKRKTCEEEQAFHAISTHESLELAIKPDGWQLK